MRTLALVLVGLLWGTTAQAQLWSSVIDTNRATDWTTAGATIVVRDSVTNRCGNILATTSTTTQINTAITNCSNGGGGVVLLAAGTFTMNDNVALKSNVTLRGAGSSSTILNWTGISGTANYFWFSGDVAVLVQGAFNAGGYPGNPAFAGADNSRTWTGTNGTANVYTKGATVLNLGTAPTGLLVGDMLTLWQSNDSDASVPKAGYFVSYKSMGSGSLGISHEGTGGLEGQPSSMQQRVRVTNVAGTQVTVTPGLIHPTGLWQTSLSPRASWNNGGHIINAGVENLTIQTTSLGDHGGLLHFWQAEHCWARGVILRPKFGASAARNGFMTADSKHITIRDSWIGQLSGGSHGSTTSYGIEMNLCTSCLVENNIFQQVESPMMVLTGNVGSVFAYNYEFHVSGEGGFQFHDINSTYTLVEGNSVSKIWQDYFHGPGQLNTIFRNHTQGNGPGTDLASYARFYNIIGNVYNNSAQYKSLVTDASKLDRFSDVGIRMGYSGSGATGGATNGVAADNVVFTSAMLWGNYAVSGGTRFLSAEVPTTEPTFPNAVPASQTLPASFFRSSIPAYFTRPSGATVAWPPTGPDVTGGTITGLAGHANKIPAQVCFESATVTTFNSATCYTSSGADSTPPAAPTGLRVI